MFRHSNALCSDVPIGSVSLFFLCMCVRVCVFFFWGGVSFTSIFIEAKSMVSEEKGIGN